MQLPAPYIARPYVGDEDHPAMTKVLAAYRGHIGHQERASVEQMDLHYAHLEGCDTSTDIALIEDGGELVAYSRVYREDLASGTRDCVGFAPTLPAHLAQPLFGGLVAAHEAHSLPWADGSVSARFRAFAQHPGPDRPATGEAAWLEALGYAAAEWSASLRRPDLEAIPERSLPEGVELRPVTEEQVRRILAAHWEAFRDEWDYREPTEDDVVEVLEDPYRDITLWKVAWAGDEVVGQVKSFINPDENAERGYRRGYTEYISTHRDWRNRGIAGTLLAWSLQELKDRGMTEAALGVDTNNPGGAFHLYTSLGFRLQTYEAVYTKAIR